MKKRLENFYTTQAGNKFLNQVCDVCAFETETPVAVIGYGEPYKKYFNIMTCPLADCLDFLPYRSQSFKSILVVHVLEYVPDPAFLIKEIKRIAAPGAKIVCVTPAVQNNNLPTQSLFSAAQIRQELKAQNLQITGQKELMNDRLLGLFSFSDAPFIATIAQKEDIVPVFIKKPYKSSRMTKASVFTSPRV